MNMPKIQVFYRHDIVSELVDYLEKVETYNWFEICGDFVVFDVDDPDTIPDDIRKISREAEHIKNIYNQVGWPWMAREVLDKKAIIANGTIVYLKPKSMLRREVENIIGELMSDDDFKTVLNMATQDIKANRLSQGKFTPMSEVIKIAARCAKALKRCGR